MSTARRRDRVRNRSRDVLGAGRTRGVSRGRLEGADEALRRRLLFVLPGRRGLYRPGDRIAPAALRYPAAHSDYRGRRWNRDELVGRLALRRRADHRRRRSRAAQNRARDARARRAITDPSASLFWSHPPDSNRRPADYESAALPTELGWLSIALLRRR